jgi:hypothetical protein
MAKKKTEGAAAPRRRTPRSGSSSPSGNVPSGNGSSNPTFEEIAEAAYQRYLSRGGSHGQDFDDWIEAERELTRRHTS